jgi:hypothetical protein
MNMWKNFILLMVALTCTVFAMGQKKDWPAMHQFHAVMSKTFHPAEEGNLQPLRDSAALLVTRAVAWQKSAVPEGYNGKVTAPILKKLVKQCKTVAQQVKAGKKDDELLVQITKAHDIFHEIMEKCRH